MTLAADTPWASEVTGDDSLVNYASNLAGPENFPGFLGPVAGRSPGFANYGASYLNDYDPNYDNLELEGYWGDFLSDPPMPARFIGALANAALGVVVLPEYLGAQYSPNTKGRLLASAAIGAALGWFFPLPTTVLYSGMLAREAFTSY